MLAPWNKNYDQPRQHITKQRHYFANNGPSSETYGFSSSHVWIWELEYKESWALKNWYFQLWCWRRLLKVPWTARRLNQSILKEISPEYSLGGLTLKLKLQYFGHLMRRINSLEKTLMLRNIEDGRRRGDRRWDDWMASPTWWTWVWASSRSWWSGKPGMLIPWGHKELDTSEWLNWRPELNLCLCLYLCDYMSSHFSELIPLCGNTYTFSSTGSDAVNTQ